MGELGAVMSMGLFVTMVLGVHAAVWIALLFAVGFTALFAYAWVTSK